MRARTEEDSLKQLLDGAVDYTLMDELVVQYIVSNYPEQARTRLQLGSTPLLTRRSIWPCGERCPMHSPSSAGSTRSSAA